MPFLLDPTPSIPFFSCSAGELRLAVTVTRPHARASGDLIGFLDADGTCDPRSFAPMCCGAVDGADLVVGNRLVPRSKMPLVRRLGNRVFALILSSLNGQGVTDTCSGMRIIRRTALASVYPLPDGLHFTPSMSTLALLSGMRVVEIPISFAERVGSSKLNILRDGPVFLGVILSGVLRYRPDRLFLAGSVTCLLARLMLAVHPLGYCLRYQLEQAPLYQSIKVNFPIDLADNLTGRTATLTVYVCPSDRRTGAFQVSSHSGRSASRSTRPFSTRSVHETAAS